MAPSAVRQRRPVSTLQPAGRAVRSPPAPAAPADAEPSLPMVEGLPCLASSSDDDDDDEADDEEDDEDDEGRRALLW